MHFQGGKFVSSDIRSLRVFTIIVQLYMYYVSSIVQILPGVGDGKDKKWEKVLGPSQEQAVPGEYRSLHKKF